MVQHADIDHTGLTGVGGGYEPGGTDVALADGGTGASLADPNADRIMFWDDSAGAVTWLQAGTNLTITATTIDASGAAGPSTTDYGTTSAGGSDEVRNASTYWAKKITTSSTKPLMSVAAHVKGNGSNISGYLAALLDDNAGAPGKMIAFAGMPAALYGNILSSTYRWVYVPLWYPVANSTDYWIVWGCSINSGNAVTIAYTGSGTDRLITGTSTMTDGGWGASTGNNYSIRGAAFG